MEYARAWDCWGIPESVRTGMQRTNDLFGSAVVTNREINALDNIYTVDARILPPGADSIQGRAQIKGFWQQAIAGLGVRDAKLTTVDAQAAGDSVIEVGRADLTLDAGQILTVKYVVHWKEEDGIWKWHTDIWNMNQ